MATKIQRDPEIDIFVVLAYDILRKDESGKQYPYVHTVWSGFNQAFRQLFVGKDPVEYTQMLEKAGCVKMHLFQGGARFQPTEVILRELSPEESALSARLREFLENFHAAHLIEKARKKAEKAAKQAKKPVKVVSPKRSSAEVRAAKNWQKGNTAAALAKLGY